MTHNDELTIRKIKVGLMEVNSEYGQTVYILATDYNGEYAIINIVDNYIVTHGTLDKVYKEITNNNMIL